MTRSRTPADVPREINDAREHLSALARAADRVTDHDLYLDTGSSETPGRTPKRVTSPALWEPSRRSLHGRWQQAWRHMADAHRHLLDGTDVAAGWVHAIADTGDAGRPPAHLAPTVTPHQARHCLRLMAAMLDSLDTADLHPPEAEAVFAACEEIGSARNTLYEETEPGRREPRRCARQDCLGPDGRPRPAAPDRKLCWACVKREQRVA